MTRPLVGLVKGESEYGAVRAHVDDLAQAFEAEGCDTRVVDLTTGAHQQFFDLYEASRQQSLAFVHGMVGWGVDTRAEGHSLFDILGCPYIHHMQDPPYYFHERLLDGPSRHKVAVHDSAYESYLARVPGAPVDRQLLTCGGTAPSAEILPHEARDIDVLISMSVTPQAQLAETMAGLTHAQRRIVGAIIEETLDTADIPIHDAAFRAMGPFGIEDWFANPVTHAPYVKFARHCMMVAYGQVHALRRLRLAPQLLALPARIHGNGWDSVKTGTVRADVRGATGFRDIQALSARSRIALNVMPPVNDAPHDRTFYAMLAGAAYLTDPNAFFRREYWEGDELHFFDLRTTTLVEQVHELLADPVSLAAVADAGRESTAARHTWRHRARELLAFAETNEPATA